MNDPLPVIERLARKLDRAEAEALVYVALLSSTPGADIASLLGIPEDRQEHIYQECRTKHALSLAPKPRMGWVA